MSDSLADRLKKKAEERRLAEQSARDTIAFQEQVNAYISDHAQTEYDSVLVQLKERIGKVNADLGELPPYQWQAMMIVQGNCVASLAFTKPIVNRPNNQLLVAFGMHPQAIYFMEERPEPVRYRMHAAATDTLDGIVWVGDADELTSAQLVEFVLENLTEYYLQHKPRSY
jgi:hypothetical protein